MEKFQYFATLWNVELNAAIINEFYRCRWQINLVFKWIKQHLRIKALLGTSENTIKPRIWIAVSI